MLSYSLIAQFLLYFIVLRLFSSFTIHPVVAGLITAVGAFAVEFTISSILYSQYGITPLDLLLSAPMLVKLILQIVVGIIIFSLIRKYEDFNTTYIILAVFGGIALFYIAPLIAANLT